MGKIHDIGGGTQISSIVTTINMLVLPRSNSVLQKKLFVQRLSPLPEYSQGLPEKFPLPFLALCNLMQVKHMWYIDRHSILSARKNNRAS